MGLRYLKGNKSYFHDRNMTLEKNNPNFMPLKMCYKTNRCFINLLIKEKGL